MNSELSNGFEETYLKATLNEVFVKAREAAGIDISALSSELKIKKSFIVSLENGEFHSLPPGPYTRAFLITLSKRLKLNPSEIIRQFNKEIRQTEALSAIGTNNSVKPRETNLKKTPLILVSILTIVLITCLLTLRKNQTIPSGQISPDIKETSKMMNSPDSSTLADLSQKNEISGTDEKLNEGQPKETAETGPVKAIKENEKEAAKTTQNNPEKKSKKPGHSLIILKSVTDSVWITVKRKGQRAANRILFKNDIWKVSHSDTIFIKSGVTGGVEFSMDKVRVTPARTRITIFNGKIIK